MTYTAIVGSREFGNLNLVKDFVGQLPKDTVVVSGGAKGVDTCGIFHARRNKLSVIVIHANWDKNSRKAGFIRNREIIELIKSKNGAIHAFWDKTSHGTRNIIDEAIGEGITSTVHYEDGTTEQFWNHKVDVDEEDIPF